jgi:tetratricopeptide (TPR) repeat protein
LLQSAEGGELRGWLALRQHVLIEEAIEKLLKCIVNKSKECEELGDALEPWKIKGVMDSLREVSEKVRDVSTAVEYFVGNYGKDFTDALRDFSNCWKRAALIIGQALAGRASVPRPEDLRKDVAESLGDALRECDVDYYLLVGEKIPPLIMIGLVINGLAYTLALARAFIDKYNEAVAEVNRILHIARDRGSIYNAEEFYGLGLASIIAAARLDRDVKPDDADIALRIASFAIQSVALPHFIESVLGVLEPLRDKAPLRYLELLAPASNMMNLDVDTVRYILSELNKILDNYGGMVKEHAWSLVYVVDAYAALLTKYLAHFNREEVRDMIGRVVDLLNELGKFESKLGVIAWAHALAPALNYEDVRGLMEEKLGIDVVNKASEVLKELNDMRERVLELMRDKEFMSYIESRFVKADENAVKEIILEAASLLKEASALYRLDNDELDEAEDLFKEAFKEYWEIGQYENYLIARIWVMRVEAIKGSLVGKELVDGFRQLYEETFKEHFEHTAPYLSIASSILGNYLVSLALISDIEGIRKLPEKHWWVLYADWRTSVLTRFMLNALLGSRGGLSNELDGKLSVSPEELINAFESDIHSRSLPALRVAFNKISPEDGIKLCEEFNDEVCKVLVLAVKGNSAVVKQLKEWVIDAFNNSLKGFGFDVESLTNEFRGLVSGLDGRSLVQLVAPGSLRALLALMLHAVISGNKELAKAYALKGAVSVAEKLPKRLFLEAYRACCDLKKESFRHALARLFFYHV